MKKLLILILLLFTCCAKVTVYEEETLQWEIVYQVNSIEYTHGFPGDKDAHYEIIQVNDYNVLLVYYNATMVTHTFKTKDEITVLSFNLINNIDVRR